MCCVKSLLDSYSIIIQQKLNKKLLVLINYIFRTTTLHPFNSHMTYRKDGKLAFLTIIGTYDKKQTNMQQQVTWFPGTIIVSKRNPTQTKHNTRSCIFKTKFTSIGLILNMKISTYYYVVLKTNKILRCDLTSLHFFSLVLLIIALNQ